MEREIQERLEIIHATPNKELGQHFLVNQEALSFLEENVLPGGVVIEIGTGVGQVTELLAKNAGHVFAFEIDTRYQPILDTIQKTHPHVNISYQSALDANYTQLLQDSGDRPVQIIASLPYHITEPFIFASVRLPIDEMILITGKNFSDILSADVHDQNSKYSLLTLLVHTFYDVRLEKILKRDDFYPPPRTKSALLRFIPHQEDYFRTQNHFLLRRLFFSGGGLIKNMLRDGYIAFADTEYLTSQGERTRRLAGQHTLTKNQARAKVAELSLPESILNKSLSQLTREEIRILANAFA